MNDEDVLKARLAILRQQHRELDEAVTAAEAMPLRDELHIRRLKKQKLYLRDQIMRIEEQLNPDITA